MLNVLLTYRARVDLPVAVSTAVGVVTAALAVTASRLARTDAQRRIAVWIASHDHSSWRGWSGMVRLELGKLPWEAASFEKDRDFLLAVIDELLAGELPEQLHDRFYFPALRNILPDPLEICRILLRAFMLEHAQHDAALVWGYNGGAAPASLVRCVKHDVYLHTNGCIVGNLPVR
jgi:hypothetical protein